MSVNTNESIANSYMTQATILPSFAPVIALANFDSEDDHIWIGDSGASSHLTNDNQWMYQIQPIQGSVMVVNGHKIHLESRELLDVTFIQRDGSIVSKTIKVKLSPDLNQKQFSFTAALANHWSI